MLLFINKQTPV